MICSLSMIFSASKTETLSAKASATAILIPFSRLSGAPFDVRPEPR